MQSLDNNCQISLSEYNYPKEVTKDNIGNLLERARLIKRKNTVSMFLTSFIVSIITIPVLFGFLFLGTYVAEVWYPTSPIQALITVIAFLLLFGEFLLFFLLDFVEYLINKGLKLNYRESVFASCILISNFLYSKKTEAAKKEVNGLIPALLGLKRTSGREYTEEINSLSNGKRQLKRMLSFSENKVPELFLSFGASVYFNDDPMAYLFLKSLLKEIKHYGKIEGPFRKLENLVTSYKGLTALFLSIVGIIIAILGKGIFTG
jgi:hypothetical protein